MPTRSKRSTKKSSDPFEAVKPLIVLGLLGMILYGAFTVIRRGPSGAAAPVIPGLEPPTVTVGGGVPPATPAAQPPAVQPFVSEQALPQPLVPQQAGSPPAVSQPPVPQPIVPQPDMPEPAVVAQAPPPTPPADPAVAVPVQSADPPLVLKAVSAAPPAAEPEGSLADPPAMPAAVPPLAADAAVAATAIAATAKGPEPFSPPAVAASVAPERQSAAFAAAWNDAHGKLAAARYAEALGVLSAWHDDPSLGPEETDRLEELLGQLAGTVIYSQEDHLLPPHIVAPGENLRDIAAGLNVPWQVLAKINGVEGPARLVPGEPLKVVAGPFDAVVSLSRRRLSLQLKGSYAGSFNVAIGRQVEEHVGTTLSVQRIRRGARSPAAAPVAATAVVQAAHEQPQSAAKQILIAGGLVIESADDPATAADSAGGKSLVVSSRDLDELIDILGEGSRVFVRP